MDTLLYTEEHRNCLNYRIPPQARLVTACYPGDKSYHIVDTQESAIIFVLEGEVYVSCNDAKEVLHTAGHMSFLPRNANCYTKTVKPCITVSCSFPQSVTLCDKFSFQQLPQYLPDDYTYQFQLLPMHECIVDYCRFVRKRLIEGLGCTHFHELKQQELFILLRAYYSKEELAKFFFPIISRNQDFKDFVYAHYLKVDNLNEFAALANVSIDTFKRRFKETFGESAHRWCTRQKVELLYRDIAMTEKTLAEIAEQYRFSSVSYLTTFCKQHLGKTPQQLRNEAKFFQGQAPGQK